MALGAMTKSPPGAAHATPGHTRWVHVASPSAAVAPRALLAEERGVSRGRDRHDERIGPSRSGGRCHYDDRASSCERRDRQLHGAGVLAGLAVAGLLALSAFFSPLAGSCFGAPAG